LSKRPILAALLSVALSTAALPLAAQDSSTFLVGVLGGLGGAFEGAQDNRFDHRALELEFGVLTNDRTYAVARAGRLRFDDELAVGGLLEAELEFVTVAGEYRFRQPSYDFGMFLGLGGYRLSGREPGAEGRDETALGLAFGLTGDFDVTRHLSVVGEFSAHYAFLDRADLYGLGLVGLAAHF
jgi:hypothetical protein